MNPEAVFLSKLRLLSLQQRHNMIFKKFEETDIVSGRITKVSSGYWPEGLTYYSQSLFVDDFWSLTSSAAPSPSYGNSYYDVRKTMYYLNVYPNSGEYTNNNPYFSLTYGNFYGNLGSGSFSLDTASIQAYPSKAIYTQYQNILLGSGDLDGKFSMKSGSTTVDADDIWVISFSTYKMKDKIDEGLIELSFSGSNGVITLIDDSYYTTQNQSVYQLITGSLESRPASPTYAGLGMLYPNNGVVILNATLLAERLGLWDTNAEAQTGNNISGWDFQPGLISGSYSYNHKTLFESMKLCISNTSKVRKSEYVPARHYFVRVKNRDFNYSNNPTYVWQDTTNDHAKGTIRNTDFIDDPKTYVTTVGLYNENNELVAVAKLSRPFVKSFDSELLIKCRLDF